MGLKLNGTRQFVFFSGGVNLQGGNIIATKNKTGKFLSDVSRMIVGLELNAEEISRPVCSGLRKCRKF